MEVQSSYCLKPVPKVVPVDVSSGRTIARRGGSRGNESTVLAGDEYERGWEGGPIPNDHVVRPDILERWAHDSQTHWKLDVDRCGHIEGETSDIGRERAADEVCRGGISVAGGQCDEKSYWVPF